jgi:branched-chain amino acid aminotransferase
MDPKYVFVNNTFLAEDKASLLVSDLAIQRGYGIFDFFKTINGKPIFLEDHLKRFYNSIAKMHMEIKQSPDELKDILQDLQQINDIPDSGIKMIVTGGYSEDGYTQPAKQNLIITQTPFVTPTTFNANGISLATYHYQRPLSEMKTIDYSMAIWLQPWLKEQKADDVLYQHGNVVRECPRANFFIVTKNLLGLRGAGFKITERDFIMEELQNASEAFITSTTKHILPVKMIDQVPLPGDGAVTQLLADLLLQKVKAQY